MLSPEQRLLRAKIEAKIEACEQELFAIEDSVSDPDGPAAALASSLHYLIEQRLDWLREYSRALDLAADRLGSS